MIKESSAICIALLLLMVFSLGCTQEKEYLAKVGNRVITAEDFTEKVSKFPLKYQEVINANKEDFLNEMIVDELVYQEALKENVHKQVEVKDLIKEAQKKVIITKFMSDKVDSTYNLSDEEIRAFYDTNIDSFKTPEVMRASHIMLKTEEAANHALQRLKDGKDFAQLAKEISSDATGVKGGDIGYFTKRQVNPDFANAAFALNQGEMSNVVKTKYGYHIILITERKLPSVERFADVKDRVKQHLIGTKKKKAFEDLIQTLKEKHSVVINASSPALKKETLNGEDKKNEKTDI